MELQIFNNYCYYKYYDPTSRYTFDTTCNNMNSDHIEKILYCINNKRYHMITNGNFATCIMICDTDLIKERHVINMTKSHPLTLEQMLSRMKFA